MYSVSKGSAAQMQEEARKVTCDFNGWCVKDSAALENTDQLYLNAQKVMLKTHSVYLSLIYNCVSSWSHVQFH